MEEIRDAENILNTSSDQSQLEETPFDLLKNKYVLVAILLAIAGTVYGLTYAFKSLQINFTLYCCSVWFVCLALIFLANYTRSSPSN
jgi:hypothetical protein